MRLHGQPNLVWPSIVTEVTVVVCYKPTGSAAEVGQRCSAGQFGCKVSMHRKYLSIGGQFVIVGGSRQGTGLSWLPKHPAVIAAQLPAVTAAPASSCHGCTSFQLSRLHQLPAVPTAGGAGGALC